MAKDFCYETYEVIVEDEPTEYERVTRKQMLDECIQRYKEYPFLFYKKNDNIDFNRKLDELHKLNEKEIGIQIYLSQEDRKESIIKCVDFLRRQNVFYYKKGRK